MKKQSLVSVLRCKVEKSAHMGILCDVDVFTLGPDLFSAFTFSRIVIFR